MKIRNILFYIFTLNFLAFRLAICSEQDLQTIQNIMATMDETTAQDILDGFHEYQQNNGNRDDVSSLSSYGSAVSYEIELNDIAPEQNQMHRYSSELHASLADFQCNFTDAQESELKAVFGVETSSPEKRIREQKIFRNDLLSKGFGITAIYAALHAPEVLELCKHVILPDNQKRVFVIDDILATMAAKSVWTAVVPSVVTGIAGIMAWRQVDHWLHAEERSRFVVLENKFNMAVTDIKKDIVSQLAKRDKEATAQQAVMHEHVDTCIKSLEKQFKTLSDHCDQQAVATKKLVQEMSHDTQEKNEATTKLIVNAQASIENARTEMAGIQATITSLKENNVEMKSNLARMNPTMQRILLATQGIVQSQGGAFTAHQLTRRSSPQDLLASIHIERTF